MILPVSRWNLRSKPVPLLPRAQRSHGSHAADHRRPARASTLWSLRRRWTWRACWARTTPTTGAGRRRAVEYKDATRGRYGTCMRQDIAVNSSRARCGAPMWSTRGALADAQWFLQDFLGSGPAFFDGHSSAVGGESAGMPSGGGHETASCSCCGAIRRICRTIVGWAWKPL